jgi:hypothetical protein
MARRRSVGLALVFLAAAGCAPARNCVPVHLARNELVDVCAPPGAYQSRDPDLIRSLTETLERDCFDPRPKARPVNVLALSGGGKYGAHTAGVMAGWTASGTRPSFDIVTGVSTGALIATYAFLGPEFDDHLRRYYTTTPSRAIYRKRSLPVGFVLGAIASSRPLQRLLEEAVTEDVLARVAQGHAEGRRLFVGTTNLDTKRLVIWDMGAIACRGGPEALALYRRILLASAAVPGFFPPVPIEVEVNGRRYTELHVDGGVTAQLFFRTTLLNLDDSLVRPGVRPLTGSHLYAVIATKLFLDPQCVRTKFGSLATEAINSLLYGMARNELYRMFTISLLTGMQFHYLALREDFRDNPDFLSFEPAEMQRLYAEGFRVGLTGEAWRTTPPGTEPQDQAVPRAGTRFVAPPGSP